MRESQPNSNLVENAYASPQTVEVAPSSEGAPRRTYSPQVRRAGKLLLIAFIGLVAWGGLAVAFNPRPGNPIFIAGFGICTLILGVATFQSVVGVFSAQFAPNAEANAFASLGLGVINAFMTFIGVMFTAFATFGFVRGRQIRSLGRVRLPLVIDGDAWAKLPMQLDVPPEDRDAVAARWRWNGQTEHASVAAFAQLTLDLIALGAPPSLISAANRDAKDEIRHAELCFSLARAIDGRSESPDAFPQAKRSNVLPHVRPIALAQLAVNSLVDGALHEGVSARVIARLAKRCSELTIRAVLTEIAADEGRHAAHGWDVVEWCLAEGGESVASALRGAIEALPKKVDSDLPEAARFGAWERYGIHSAAMEAEEYSKAHEQIVRRVRELVEARQAA